MTQHCKNHIKYSVSHSTLIHNNIYAHSTHQSHNLKQRKERTIQRLKIRPSQHPLQKHPLKQRSKHDPKYKKDQPQQHENRIHLGNHHEYRQHQIPQCLHPRNQP